MGKPKWHTVVPQWTPEEVQAYCMEKFESKRPDYLRKAEQLAGE